MRSRDGAGAGDRYQPQRFPATVGLRERRAVAAAQASRMSWTADRIKAAMAAAR
jgi:hypothetical protein